MILGIDFDNTIVCYDRVFFETAREAGLVAPDTAVTKTGVRDHLRRAGREADWIAMQGEVYGCRMDRAEPFSGVMAFLRRCREQRLPVVIVSHKTRFPYAGPRYDLHRAAMQWMDRSGFFDPAVGLAPAAVFFEPTQAAKCRRIGQAGCTHFIDDLPEVFAVPPFPAGVQRILFDPDRRHRSAAVDLVFEAWSELDPDRLAGDGPVAGDISGGPCSR